MMRVTGKAMLLFLLGLVAAWVEAQKFYPDDPVLVDNDKLDVPVKPREIELSDMYDRFGHMFKDWGASPIGSEAKNVNTLDEVPDSSWFTNRHGKRRFVNRLLSKLKRSIPTILYWWTTTSSTYR